jgi:hypothetical protein
MYFFRQTSRLVLTGLSIFIFRLPSRLVLTGISIYISYLGVRATGCLPLDYPKAGRHTACLTERVAGPQQSFTASSSNAFLVLAFTRALRPRSSGPIV